MYTLTFGKINKYEYDEGSVRTRAFILYVCNNEWFFFENFRPSIFIWRAITLMKSNRLIYTHSQWPDSGYKVSKLVDLSN